MKKPNKYQNNINSRLMFFYYVVNYSYKKNKQHNSSNYHTDSDNFSYNMDFFEQLKSQLIKSYDYINKRLQQLKEFSKLNPLSVFIIQAAMSEYIIYPDKKSLIIQQYINITKDFNPTGCNLVHALLNKLLN